MALEKVSWPDYHGGSIVNLMSSISTYLDWPSEYVPLAQLPVEDFEGVTNVVLLVLDGVGYDFLQQYGQGCALLQDLRSEMTSVFPTTTAAAMSAIYSGLAPQNHGVPGWYTYLRELGLVATILPMIARGTGRSFLSRYVHPDRILDAPSLFDNINADGYVLLPRELQNSAYNQIFAGSARQIGYRNMPDFFGFISKIITRHLSPKFVLGYWPEFDSIAHKAGPNSVAAQDHFHSIDAAFAKFVDGLSTSGGKSKIIVTADHGFIEGVPDHAILLKNHPELEECLAVPLCGEPRAAFCYVRPSKVVQFEEYVQNNLAQACSLIKSEDLIAQGRFGLFNAHPRLFDRVGDYVLLMKDNFVVKDELVGEKHEELVGFHGGVSSAEMFVPLIIRDV
ncbi:MAG TPA: alkaline phosphatase family protein [Candidatus Lokiarchaeia archaeon]|nr:alkaline phosphatase family protein [Candidatus Lokiarchaeia archaeon]